MKLGNTNEKDNTENKESSCDTFNAKRQNVLRSFALICSRKNKSKHDVESKMKHENDAVEINEANILQAARDINMKKAELALIFPNTINDFVGYIFEDWLNDAHEVIIENSKTKADDAKFMNMRFSHQVKTLGVAQFHVAALNENLLSSVAAFVKSPANILHSKSALYNNASEAINLTKDQSTDMSFYTKRMVLGAIYAKTLLFWLNSKDINATCEEFCNNVDSLKNISKAKSAIKSVISAPCSVVKSASQYLGSFFKKDEECEK